MLNKQVMQQAKGMTASIPTTMRGVYLEEFGKPYVYRHDIPVPTPHDDELLIQVSIAGYCHTETIVARGEYTGKVPMIPGHENVGVVVSVGSEVKNFQVGDRVGCSLFRRSCGNCRECKRGGSTNFCSKVELAGLTHDGGMAEYLVADPKWTIKLPDRMSFEEAAPFMCAGSTMFNSIRQARQPKDSIIGIVGLGGLGHLGVQFVKAMGFRCVAIDIRQEPRSLVESFEPRFRPDLVLNPEDGIEHCLSEIQTKFSGSDGVNAIIVSADTNQAFQFSAEILEKHGSFVVVGQPKDPIQFHWRAFVAKDITIIPGGLGQPEVVHEMMDLVVRAGIHSESKVYQLQDVNKLVEDFHNAKMRGKFLLRVTS